MKMRVEYGPVGLKKGFYFWFIGGPNFEGWPGDFQGPFATIQEAKMAAESEARKEKVECFRVTSLDWTYSL